MNEEREPVVEGQDTTQEAIPGVTTSTMCEHEYTTAVLVGDLMEVVCSKCWHGCAFDPATQELVAGKIVARNV